MRAVKQAFLGDVSFLLIECSNFLPPVQIIRLLCTIRASSLLNLFPHGQMYFLALWEILCLIKSWLRTNALVQPGKSHEYGLSCKCVWICDLMLYLRLNTLLQLGYKHSNSLSGSSLTYWSMVPGGRVVGFLVIFIGVVLGIISSGKGDVLCKVGLLWISCVTGGTCG